MEPLQDNYPVFEANQVLTNAHLNQIFDYLNEQPRLTRANLLGIGIVCGLEVKFASPPATIGLSRGCGISSEGYLLTVPNNLELVAYRSYQLPNDIDYPALKNSVSGTQFPLWELFPAGEPETTPLGNPSGFLDDKAVLLFLELKKTALRNCSPNNCDDKGSAVTATVRPLLINLNNLPSNAPLTLPELPLPRVNFSIPAHLSDYEKVYRDYFTVNTGGKTAITRLAEAFEQAYQALKTMIPDLDKGGISQLPSRFIFPNNANVIPIQYHYNLLRDLTAAYHELRTALLQQSAICLPDSAWFPRHLVLGSANNTDANPYRTPFYPSPTVASPQQKSGTLRFLFERLNRMVQNFNIPSVPAIPIKITPSQFGLKQLSGKSMPFYYNPELRPHWDANLKGAQSHGILSWHDDIASPDSVRNPLQYDLEPYNFFRIEGHVGKNLLNVSTDLGNLIKSNRLPLSILYLNADAAGNFLDQHYAIEHAAGVMRGCTFIVLYRGIGSNANTVLADFALPYRIEKTAAADCLCRVMVNECEYPWFDSKRHLSNLALREYRFAPRPAVHAGSNQKLAQEADRTVLAAYYVIRIYRYEIQGQSLLGGITEQIQIPINELISGQLSAIARKLNEKFPNGLVFDYNNISNKLVIRYFADQTFRIEWGGLQGNQIRYAYTPNDVYRWQNDDWESMRYVADYEIVSRLRNEYRADEYRWLHEDSYYESKYPTPAPLPTAKELIEWENMIRARASIGVPISNLLGEIRSSIDETYNVGGDIVQVVLIGSWANGSWVSNISSQNNLPAGFLSLRQKVTGKTGPSDIDLLINTEDQFITAEAILTLLQNNYQISASGYAINIVLGKKDAQKWASI